MSNQDRAKISNVYSEARYAAEQLSKQLNREVPVSMIYMAKEATKSNNRQVIYKWVEEHIGTVFQL